MADVMITNARGGALAAIVGLMLVLGICAPAARAQNALDCHSEQAHGDQDRRIAGCSELIEQGGLGDDEKALALAARALAHSLKGDYADAIGDYDRAIALQPNFAVALNNRAWANFRWGRAAAGERDVEKSLSLDPSSPHTFDTRAHIHQSLGRPEKALSDYWKAMQLGGSRIVRMYQCGLTERGHYKGELDGQMRPEFTSAMVACIRDRGCDPLPADEQCRAATS